MQIPNNGHLKHYPRLIAWEVTRMCGFKCKHCRASASDVPYPGELTVDECLKLLDNISSEYKPIIILTGGEPMTRKDIYEIVKYGSESGLRMVMAPCGYMMDENSVKKLIESGIQRISLSIDGADKITHDSFRQVEGAFDSVINAAKISRDSGLEFQVNTTITKFNYTQIEKIFELAVKLGAVSYHPFLLVPVGRGKELSGFEISPEEYENILTWFYEKSKNSPIMLKPTCAPHYYRILKRKEVAENEFVPAKNGLNAMVKGCIGGQSFAFISHTGKVQICGFLDAEAGDLKKENFNFCKIWKTSKLFNEIRDIDSYKGKCGYCEYRRVCGGCRARAFAATGDYLKEEPYCIYLPKPKKS